MRRREFITLIGGVVACCPTTKTNSGLATDGGRRKRGWVFFAKYPAGDRMSVTRPTPGRDATYCRDEADPFSSLEGLAKPH
jgi:hypothetical protein